MVNIIIIIRDLFNSREHKINRILIKIEEIERSISSTEHLINYLKSVEKANHLDLKDNLEFFENNLNNKLAKINRLKDQIKILAKK